MTCDGDQVYGAATARPSHICPGRTGDQDRIPGSPDGARARRERCYL